MGVQVAMPQKKQEGSMGRRLFAMGAPIVGGLVAGPAGAAAGSFLGSKLNGASNENAVLGAAESGVGAMGKGVASASPSGASTAEGLNLSQKMQMPEVGSAFGRRMEAQSLNPHVAINDGLDALTELPPALREQYAPALVKSKMLLEKPQLGASYARRGY